MKSNELMTGDWVMVSYVETNLESKKGKYGKVEMLEYDNNYTGIRIWIDTKFDTYFCERENEIAPIPITAEMLVKNGFEHKHQGEPEKRKYWILRYNGGQVKAKINRGKFYFEITGVPKISGFFCPSFRSHLDYVHELQQALRFCRIDKEIELKDLEL